MLIAANHVISFWSDRNTKKEKKKKKSFHEPSVKKTQSNLWRSDKWNFYKDFIEYDHEYKEVTNILYQNIKRVITIQQKCCESVMRLNRKIIIKRRRRKQTD